MNEQKLKQAIEAALSLEGDKIDTARVAARVAAYMVVSEKLEGQKIKVKEFDVPALDIEKALKDLEKQKQPSYIPTPPPTPVSPTWPWPYCCDRGDEAPMCEDEAEKIDHVTASTVTDAQSQGKKFIKIDDNEVNLSKPRIPRILK